MIKVYCYSKCSTCKKALKWLDDRGVAYEKIDLKEKNPGEAELREYHAKSGAFFWKNIRKTIDFLFGSLYNNSTKEKYALHFQFQTN